jgi:hypothetical protein
MKRDEQEQATPVIELGTVSGDTKGGIGLHWETGGMRRDPGITDD